MTIIIESPFGNYYGCFMVKAEDDGKFYACIENYDGCHWNEISEQFYDACVKEFAPASNVVYYLINSNPPGKAYGPFDSNELAWKHLFGATPNYGEIEKRIKLGWFVAECDAAKD